MQQSNYMQFGFPVPHDQVNKGTFNQQLPNNNDKIPQLQIPPMVAMNPQLQQMAIYAVGLFRVTAQNAAETTYLHALAYNILSNNMFANNVYQQWCQKVVDFFTFLVTRRNKQPQEAVNTAASYLWQAFVARIAVAHPQIQSFVPHLSGNIQQALTLANTIDNDIAQLNTQPMNQMGMGGFQNPMNQFNAPMMNSNLPPINSGMTVNHQFQPKMASFTQAFNTQQNSQPSPSMDSYVENFNTPTKPMVPIESWGGEYDTITSQPTNGQPMNNNMTVDTKPALPIPSNVSEVVLSPTYYIPVGKTINQEKPFDHFYNPGDIEIQPAFKSKWKFTPSTSNPYRQQVDHDEYCVFFVKFPDGSVYEKIVKWDSDMEMNYLRHEIDEELRRRYTVSKGERVFTPLRMSSLMSDFKPLEEVAEGIVSLEGEIKEFEPVIIENVINGCSDTDKEDIAFNHVVEKLKLGENDKVPPHEYVSITNYPLAISDEVVVKLNELSKETDLIALSRGIRELAADQKINQRVYTFINDRLTKAVNDHMNDSMNVDWTIDSFADDMTMLSKLMHEHKGEDMQKRLMSAGRLIAARGLSVIESEEYSGLVDQFINIQTPWTLADLAGLDLARGKCVLLSKATSPVLIKTIIDCITRSGEKLASHTMRLITVDGYYFNVIRGALVPNAILLKRMN